MIPHQPIPDKYRRMREDQILEGISKAKKALGKRAIFLGHHYQRDSIIQFADFTGDSLKLAQLAATRREAEFLIFCGVHFMAESADILSSSSQKVILPDLNAGCPMADMASENDVQVCLKVLEKEGYGKIVPITYVNSTAAVKAIVGKKEGATCTSSNAKNVMKWALFKGDKVLFIPDQHLGRNTAFSLGIPLEEMVLWDPALPFGGLSKKQLSSAKIILWKGHCSVHQMFKTSHVKHIRKTDPEMKIVVHPECEFDVVQASDYNGSTEYIIKVVSESPKGSHWAIGTEIHLVDRIAKDNPDKKVIPLTRFGCLCGTMYRIDPPHLLWVLEGLLDGNVVNQVKVHPEIARLAKEALQRMFSVT